MNNTAPRPRAIPSRALRSQPPPTYGGMTGPAPVANGAVQQPDMSVDEQLAIMRRQQAQTRQAYGLPPVNPVPNAPGPFGNPGNAAGIPPQQQVYPPIPPP
jgi:hypothetical protein